MNSRYRRLTGIADVGSVDASFPLESFHTDVNSNNAYGTVRQSSSLDSPTDQQEPASPRNNHYEELPHLRYVMDKKPQYDYADERGPLPAPPSLSAGSATELASGRSSMEPPVYRTPSRKRDNPLYDHTEEQEELIKGSSRNDAACLRCLFCVVAALSVLTIFTLVLVVLLVMGIVFKKEPTEPVVGAIMTSPNGTSVTIETMLYKALQRVQELEDSYRQLQSKFELLEDILQMGPGGNATLATRVASNSINIALITNKTKIYDPTISILNSQVGLLNSSTAALENSLAVVNENLSSQSKMITEVRFVDDVQNKSLGILQTQISDVSSSQKQDISDLKKNISTHTVNSGTYIDNVWQHLQTEIYTMNSSIYHSLDTISKMEGPQGPVGPPGAGDLSLCKHVRWNEGGLEPEQVVEWKPPVTETDFVVLSAVCFSVDGQEHELKTRTFQGVVQYQCICRGTSGTSHHCYMDMWSCPTLS